MLPRSLCLLSLLLLASCASGEAEEDGVIVRADARADTGEDDEDTTPVVVNDTGVVVGEDTKTPDPEDTGSTPEDTGSTPEDTGSPPVDTGPVSCSGEESEPNDTPSTARGLASINDCDTSGGTVNGVLSTGSDVDVLTFDGTDQFGCTVNAYAKVTGPARICMRATCKSGTTEMPCDKGVKTGTECCGTEVESAVNCTGTSSDDAKITITVRSSTSTAMCAAYSLSYHY